MCALCCRLSQPWPLNDTNSLDTWTWTLVDTPQHIASIRHSLSLSQQFPLHTHVLASPAAVPTRAYAAALPAGVHLLSFLVRNGSATSTSSGSDAVAPLQLVLRLHNTVAVNEGGDAITVDLAALFPAAVVSNVQELTLTLQQPVDASQRRVWPTDGVPAVATAADVPAVRDTSVTLLPMQIRTFTLNVGATA